jgi:peptidoglycan/xylan/chitin deacetylase (PgdA/CDA1 family)
MRGQNVLRVLTYHRVADRSDPSGLSPKLISATPETFRRQAAYLARNYEVVSMVEVLEAVKHRRRLSPRSVLITFDDAYTDFKDTAWPILRELRLPATLFVPTAYPDHPERSFWWDRLWRAIMHTSQPVVRGRHLELRITSLEERRSALHKLHTYIKRLPHDQAISFVHRICESCEEGGDHPAVLSWDELRELAREGVTLGAHSRTHPILTQMPLAKARMEIRGSQEDLHQAIGKVLPIFCYPNGGYNQAILRVMRDEGFLLSLTTEDGFNHLDSCDLLRLRRINITPRTTMALFRLRLLRFGSCLNGLRQRAQRLAYAIANS